jgi:hypothetical protein
MWPRLSNISSSASEVGIAYSNSRRRSFDDRDLRVKVALPSSLMRTRIETFEVEIGLPYFGVAYCGISPRITTQKELTLNFKTHLTPEILDCDSRVALKCEISKPKITIKPQLWAGEITPPLASAMLSPRCLGESIERDLQISTTIVFWRWQPTTRDIHLQRRQHQSGQR